MKTTQHLTDDQLLAMRQFYIDGKTVVWIAEQFNCSRVTVSSRANNTKVGFNGKTWAQLRKIRIDNEKIHAGEVLVREQRETAEEVVATKKDRGMSAGERDRRKWLRQTIREVDSKLKLPKLGTNDYLKLSKYRLELDNELVGRDEVIIIGAPEEFPDDI